MICSRRMSTRFGDGADDVFGRDGEEVAWVFETFHVRVGLACWSYHLVGNRAFLDRCL